MMQEVLTKFPFLNLSTLGLLIFFSFFVALLILINLKSQRRIHSEAERLPLEEASVLNEVKHV